MMIAIDNFLKINFEISLETYFRLTDGKLKEMLKAEIKNYLEEKKEEKQNEKFIWTNKRGTRTKKSR